MNIQDQLRSERSSLERMAKRHEVNMGRLTQDLEDADQRGVPLDNYQAKIDSEKGWYGYAAGLVKEKIANLEAQLKRQSDEQQERARAELNALKEQKRVQWVQQGGTVQSFEDVWPLMEVEILRQRVMDTSNQGPTSPALKISGL